MMRKKAVIPSFFAMAAIAVVGCGRAPTPPESATSAGRAQADATDPTVKGMADAAEILKSIKSNGPTPPGVSFNTTQVGSHRFKTSMDVASSTTAVDQKVVVKFAGQALTVEFDTGRVLLDDKEKAKLPAGTKEVEITFLSGKLTVKADGAVVIGDEEKTQ